LSKDNYAVARVGDDSPKTLTVVAEPFPSTRAALKWVKDYAEDSVSYAVIKVCKMVEVETISTKKLVEMSIGK